MNHEFHESAHGHFHHESVHDDLFSSLCGNHYENHLVQTHLSVKISPVMNENDHDEMMPLLQNENAHDEMMPLLQNENAHEMNPHGNDRGLNRTKSQNIAHIIKHLKKKLIFNQIVGINSKISLKANSYIDALQTILFFWGKFGIMLNISQ